jgi:hypothetical protein
VASFSPTSKAGTKIENLPFSKSHNVLEIYKTIDASRKLDEAELKFDPARGKKATATYAAKFKVKVTVGARQKGKPTRMNGHTPQPKPI